MNLDDFEKEMGVFNEPKVEEPVETKEVKKDDEEEDEYEESVEAELSLALNLLEDCYSIFADILKNKGGKLSPYLYARVEDTSMEAIAFIGQYDTDADPKINDRIDWKSDI
jgi:hypothetical protein